MPDPSKGAGGAPPERGWSREIRARLAGLALDASREAEIVEELTQHLEEEYDERRRAGASPEDARRLALQELLGPESLAGYMRPLRQSHAPAPIQPGSPRRSLLRDLAQDLGIDRRFGLRRGGGLVTAAAEHPSAEGEEQDGEEGWARRPSPARLPAHGPRLGQVAGIEGVWSHAGIALPVRRDASSPTAGSQRTTGHAKRCFDH